MRMKSILGRDGSVSLMAGSTILLKQPKGDNSVVAEWAIATVGTAGPNGSYVRFCDDAWRVCLPCSGQVGMGSGNARQQTLGSSC